MPTCSTCSSGKRSSIPGRRVRPPCRDRAAARRPLSRPVEALERWKLVLDQDPENAEAIAAVEAALGDFDLRVTAADILRPVYDGTKPAPAARAAPAPRGGLGDDRPRSCGRSARSCALASTSSMTSRRLRRPATRAAARGDRAGAPHVIARSSGSAGELGREADFDRRVSRGRSECPRLEIQRRLYLDVADLSRGGAHDSSSRRVLPEGPRQPHTTGAPSWHSRASIRETNDVEKADRRACCGRPMRRPPTSTNRVGSLVEAAGLYIQLGRLDDAISTWEQVLAVAPSARMPSRRSNAVREQGRWPDVVDLVTQPALSGLRDVDRRGRHAAVPARPRSRAASP